MIEFEAAETRSPQSESPALGFSPWVTRAGVTWTAGFAPHDPITGEIPDGIAAQTRQTIANLEAALSNAGLSLQDVVKVTVHLQNLTDDFTEFDTAYRERFIPPYPARTTVGSDLMGFLVEIDVVAIPREGRR